LKLFDAQEEAMKRIYIMCSLVLMMLGSFYIFFTSSDPTLLVYVQFGDLYVKRLPKGEGLRLTQDGLNSNPRISASGMWLAFQKGNNQLWIMKTDGKLPHLVHSGKLTHYQWSPHADQLAFTANGNLRILDAGQHESHLIVQSPGQEDAGVRSEFLWSPDGKRIAYEYDEKRDAAKGEWPWIHSIRKANVEKGESEDIVTYPPPDQEGAPGNTELAAWIGSRIYLWQCEVMSASIMADGCPLYYFDQKRKQKEVGAVSLLYTDFLDFTPDGHTLALSEGNDRITWTNKQIAKISYDTGEKQILTEKGVAAFSPTWSPEGSSLAYVAGPDMGSASISRYFGEAEMAKRRIWIMRADGSEKWQLTSDEGYREENPHWLADGQRILFTRSDTGWRVSVWLAQSNGKSLEKIADDLGPYVPGNGIASRYGNEAYYGHTMWNEVFDLKK
jgi:Tol biopolymer transport system component